LSCHPDTERELRRRISMDPAKRGPFPCDAARGVRRMRSNAREGMVEFRPV